ncbi:hypothetical protein SAMN05519104_7020 [Rhizobiales bacterium GAS188]|nr:hypothetical protein SAMN05519104_7020 [Rhizobiales bacterium GAS188]
MTPSELDELVGNCPHLYHMAMRDSWPLIQEHGLHTTYGLLDLFEVETAARTKMTTRRRCTSVPISHPVFGQAVVRDQIPLLDSDLDRCLRDGLTPQDWHRLLNGRVFFWLTEHRLQKLLCAGAYRHQDHIVLKVHTALLIRDYADRIELSPINSGCTRPYAHPRGRETFLPIASYPYAVWRKKRSRFETVVELTVIDGVPNIVDYIESVAVRSCAGAKAMLYKA